MKKSTNKGFTLIEVVLVLAIGGLIFLLAFVAFQQVSRNRRDTQRRSDAGRVLAELQNAKGDGVTVNDSTKLASFVTSYMNTPSGPNGVYTFTYGTTAPTTVENIVVSYGNKCDGGAMTTTGGNGKFAVLVKLENGITCRDDS